MDWPRSVNAAEIKGQIKVISNLNFTAFLSCEDLACEEEKE